LALLREQAVLCLEQLLWAAACRHNPKA